MNLRSVLFLSLVSIASVTKAHAFSVYVESNRGDANSLLAFDLANNGALTAKSPVSTKGLGVVDPTLALGPYDSDQEIILNADKSLLFAVNSGSNSVAVFHIDKTGVLVPVAGSPFSSHGINPVSLGLRGNILTVVNKHGDPAQSADASLPNYTTFSVSEDGSLIWTGYSITSENGSSPSQALVSPLASVIFGADFLGGELKSFLLGGQGQIHPVTSQALPAEAFANMNVPRLPLGLAAHPNKNILYVGFPTANKIGVYSYDQWGSLNFINTTNDSGAVVCWLLTNKEGTRLYASNTADPSVTVYDITSNPEMPREMQKIVLNSKGGAYQFALSPDQQQLLVLTQRFQASTPQGEGNEIHVLAVAKDGTLAEISSTAILDLPLNTRPQGIVVF